MQNLSLIHIWGTAVDFDHGIIGNLLVLCQLPFPVLLDHKMCIRDRECRKSWPEMRDFGGHKAACFYAEAGK